MGVLQTKNLNGKCMGGGGLSGRDVQVSNLLEYIYMYANTIQSDFAKRY